MSDFRQPGPPVWRRLDGVTPQTVQTAKYADAHEDVRYEAVRSRDARFDGAFFFAVETTGIYCRPSCPAVTPKRRNVRFFATAAAAQGSG
ncbi:Ada metal-binding domain-containing protein, partial [Streptomyces tendae]